MARTRLDNVLQPIRMQNAVHVKENKKTCRIAQKKKKSVKIEPQYIELSSEQ